MIESTREYQAIAAFYAERCARRSKVPLIAHINEGLDYLAHWHRSEEEMRAYAIHPLVQNSEDVDVSWSDVLPLAEEYRDRANSYLCRPETDHIKTPEQLHARLGEISLPCAFMLLADKMQNQKDFRIHHWFTHKRAAELENYFNLWIETLRNIYILPRIAEKTDTDKQKAS